MATNLKTSKKIRAFIYRIIATGGLFVFCASALMGREALVNLANEGEGTFTGKVYYVAEFREYISSLYQQAMLSYAGLGDDTGVALSSDSASAIQQEIQAVLQENLHKTGKDILYYIRYDGTTTSTASNIPYPIFSESGHLLLPDNLQLCCYWDGKNNDLNYFMDAWCYELHLSTSDYGNYPYQPVSREAAKMQVIFAIEDSEDYYSSEMRSWHIVAQNYQLQLFWIVSSGAVTLFFGLLSLISIKYGKASRQDFAHFSGKIFLEIKLLLLAGIVWTWYHFHLGYILDPLTNRVRLLPYLLLYLPIGVILYMLWTDLRFNGLKIFLQCIPVKAVHFTQEFVSCIPGQRRALITYATTALCGILSLLASLFALGICTYSYLTPIRWLAAITLFTGILLLIVSWRLRKLFGDTKAVTDKISSLHRGESSEPLRLPYRSVLAKTAMELNELENGIEAAVEQRNRSNRMRVELITNVSHDLKTPLTSIINYADLLCEEPLQEPASDYARALKEKAYRLKNMVQDVFDLSKATTGNLPVEKQRLDLVKLIRQTMADMDERISESNLTFKLNIAEEPIMIEADGDKLYRVFQNLFVNALQYSLDYSRVHIQLSAQDGYAVAKIKNTSKGELDFDTAEIMERFVRSDASRTTEGSGLGLSIVQSFTESCGGTFTIETDADMFTAQVCFPLAQEITTCEPNETITSTETDNTEAME